MFLPWKLPLLALRPWRLCRELDGYDDRECAAFTIAVSQWRYAGLASAFPITIAAGMGLKRLAEMLIQDMSTVWGRAFDAAGTLLFIAVGLWIAFLPYCAILRWALRRHINRVICPQCRYSLLGLPVTRGATTCPECGAHVALADHGLRPADLLAGARERQQAPEDDERTTDERQIDRLTLVVAALCLVAWIAIGGPVPVIVAVVSAIVYMGARTLATWGRS